MNTTVAMAVGALGGLFVALVMVLNVLMRYVASDLDGFRRWLDKAGAA